MLKQLFNKTKYITLKEKGTQESSSKPSIPNGMWVKCEECGRTLYRKDLEKYEMVCFHCKKHFRLGARERISFITDRGSFIEFDKDMYSVNPLQYKDYEEKLSKSKEVSGLNEAVITGKARINEEETVIAVMDSNFMMGSMGSVVGEKITRAVEKAIELKLPIIIFTTSGGARMQEGMFSLMQMAKTTATLKRHSDEGLLYLSVITDPTTGGVTASFALTADIVLAEPGALIGFAGRRVIEQTIKQKLPQEFQKSEFLLEHGFVDQVVSRDKLKDRLSYILKLHRI